MFVSNRHSQMSVLVLKIPFKELTLSQLVCFFKYSFTNKGIVLILTFGKKVAPKDKGYKKVCGEMSKHPIKLI